MKFTRILFLISLFIGGAFITQSCTNDNEEEMNPEYIADDNSFKGFESWTLEATNKGPDPAIGGAHGGNDTTVTRSIYFKNGQDPSGGSYPVGTLIAKHSKNPGGTVDVITAMAKRGNNFNSSGGDWEWFILNEDGSIAEDNEGNPLRGANLMGGACVSCHSVANTDFAFTK